MTKYFPASFIKMDHIFFMGGEGGKRIMFKYLVLKKKATWNRNFLVFMKAGMNFRYKQ